MLQVVIQIKKNSDDVVASHTELLAYHLYLRLADKQTKKPAT